VADVPAGVDEALGVGSGGAGVQLEGVAGEAGRGVAGDLGALGGVLGEVAGDGQAGDAVLAPVGNGADVEFAAPGDEPSFAVRAVGVGLVRTVTLAAAWRMAFSRSAAVRPGGGGTTAAGSSRLVPSRRNRTGMSRRPQGAARAADSAAWPSLPLPLPLRPAKDAVGWRAETMNGAA
jgi:hypothetical protein